MMSDLYNKGFKKGFEDDSPMDAFELSSLDDDYRVGYVIGLGESTYASAPPDYRSRLIGELAKKLRVPIAHFQNLEVIDDWEKFKRGYLGSDAADDNFDNEDE